MAVRKDFKDRYQSYLKRAKNSGSFGIELFGSNKTSKSTSSLDRSNAKSKNAIEKGNKNYSLSEKRNYYKKRLSLTDNKKCNYARGFVNGSSVNSAPVNYFSAKKDATELSKELLRSRSREDSKNIIESLCYVDGYIAGYKAKLKNAIKKGNKK